MSYDAAWLGGLDYFPCRYGTSKLLFRGPQRMLSDPYIAFLGGTETYGKFVANPFPDLVEKTIHKTCVNLGCVNAGVDVFMKDSQVLNIASGADVTVLQVTGAHNMSNRYYSVHARRNDRFLKASRLLQNMYQDVDFTQFNFNVHMLKHLKNISALQFEAIEYELQMAWVARMRQLLEDIQGKVILLWIKSHPSIEEAFIDHQSPWFITRNMINKLRSKVVSVVEVTALPSLHVSGAEGMVFSALEAPAAKQVIGPQVHEKVASAVSDCLRCAL